MRSLDIILWRLLIYLKWFLSVRVSKVNIRHCVTSVCGDILIHIFPHSDWMQKDILRISPYSVWMRENTEQNYTGYRPFLRSVEQLHHINYNTKVHNCLTYFDCTVLWHIASVWVQSFICRQKGDRYLIDAFCLLISSKMSLLLANLSKFHRSSCVVLSLKLKRCARKEKYFHHIDPAKMLFEPLWGHIS